MLILCLFKPILSKTRKCKKSLYGTRTSRKKSFQMGWKLRLSKVLGGKMGAKIKKAHAKVCAFSFVVCQSKPKSVHLHTTTIGYARLLSATLQKRKSPE